MGLQEFINKTPGLAEYLLENNCIFGQDGINTPIPDKFLKTLPNNQIVFTEDVFEKLYELAKKTQETDSEYMFLLCTLNVEDNIEGNRCLINNFFESNTNVQSRVATADKNTIDYLHAVIDLIRENNMPDGSAIFIGHTHPAVGRWYDNFSFGDLSGYESGVITGEVFEQRKIERAGCMLTGDGKFHACFFDPNRDSLYKFTDIKVRQRNGNLKDFKDCFDARYTSADMMDSFSQQIQDNSREFLNGTKKSNNFFRNLFSKIR